VAVFAVQREQDRSLASVTLVLNSPFYKVAPVTNPHTFETRTEACFRRLALGVFLGQGCPVLRVSRPLVPVIPFAEGR
jgi:hypothetical protein